MRKQAYKASKGEKIPSQKGKSYFQAWLKSSGLGGGHLEGSQRSERDGWYDLAVYILAETVLAAAQQENLQTAAEARDWLQSAAAAQWFEGCNLDHRSVRSWLKRGCPLPDALSLHPFDADDGDGRGGCAGLLSGRLALPGHLRLPPESLDELLRDAGWRFDDPF